MPPKKKIAPVAEGTGIVNMYEVIPDKYLPKVENVNKHLHNFNLPFRCCISAPSGSGKSNFLINLIRLFCAGKGTFADITIVTRNKDEPLYNWLEDQSSSIQIVEGLQNIPNLDKMDKRENHLVIFDDLLLNKDQTPMINYYIRARKLNCSVCYLSQSYYDIPPIIRKNSNYMIILKLGGPKETKSILREFAFDVSKQQLINMFTFATNEKLSPFIIDVEGDKFHKFRKGFGLYLNPSEFGPDEE